jgi:malate dehydrogenase (oxaloacetate-decarboxylating)
MLFKRFAGVDAFPICLDVTRTSTRSSRRSSGSRRLRRHQPRGHLRAALLRDRGPAQGALDIPVFHDDQHGTAVVVLAALRNALRSSASAMGDLPRRHRRRRRGRRRDRQDPARGRRRRRRRRRPQGRRMLHSGRDDLTPVKRWLAEHTNDRERRGTLADVLPAPTSSSASPAAGCPRSDVAAMADDAIVFALANPTPRSTPRRPPARPRRRHRPQRLPEPDQQRAGVPRHLPRRARRAAPPRSPRA